MGTGLSYPGVSKNYVDTQVATKVAKAGDTMSGDLEISKSVPLLTLYDSIENRTIEFTNDAAVGTIRGDVDEFDFEITLVASGVDIYVTPSTKGLILKDRATGNYRRILCTNGVLSTEAA
jgi:hypothetical protein